MGMMGLYGAASLGAGACCIGALPMIASLAKSSGLDLPDSRRKPSMPGPRFGGLAVALPMIAASIVAMLLAARFGASITQGWGRMTTLLAVSSFVLLIGLCDELVEIPSKIKLLALFAAAAAVCAAGIRLDTFILHGRAPIRLGAASWPLSMLWIVGLTVSISFSDGLKGLAAGISSVASAVIAAVALWSGQVEVAILALALLGSLSGFLAYNFSSARGWGGNCGSLFIGFMLACLAVQSASVAGATAGLALPAIALSIPIVDALLTLVRRGVVNRRSVFCADRSHIHHRLLDMGLCQLHAALILFAATLLCTAIGLLALLDNGTARMGGFVLLVPVLFGLFRTAGSARLRETLAAARRNRAIARENRRYQHAFEDMQLRFRAADTFDGWWRELCKAGEMLDFAAVTLSPTRREGNDEILSWQNPNPHLADFERLSAVVPIPDRRATGLLRAQVAVAAHTTLESAGQRLALFSRLLGEHNPTSLPKILHRRAAPSESASSHSARADADRIDLVRRRNGEEESNFLADGPAAPGLRSPDRERMLEAVKKQLRRASAVERTPRTPLELLDSRPDRSFSGIAQSLPAKLRIAIVHDFLYVYAGAEKVLEQIVALFPEADLFSLVNFLAPEECGFILNKPVKTSIIQKLPFARQKHRAYLPVMPYAVEQLDVSSYDLVISSSYLAAKGVMTGPDQLHICYCHTPPRFAWDLQHQYLAESGLKSGLKAIFARVVLHYIRAWDAHSANAVDVFATNSNFVARRIQKCYQRSAVTIYPPVAVERFGGERIDYGDREDFYLTASRLVPYKRVDLIVDAFNLMPDRRLLVVGDGPMLEKLRANAGPNVSVVGHQSFENLKRYMHLTRAFIFAAEEDFGIVPVEAQACGAPVIAFGRGGVTESVIAGKTGVFFSEQTTASLVEAVREFEALDGRGSWEHERIRRNAERFSIGRFKAEFHRLVIAEWEKFRLLRGQATAKGMASVAEETAGPPALGDSFAADAVQALVSADETD